MYMPKLYQEDDLATLHGLMRDYSFATLVTQHDWSTLCDALAARPGG